jgi:2-keto-myo-inositol isomerase
MPNSSRRHFLTATLSCASLSSPISARADASPTDDRHGFRYCLNTATISGYRLSLAEQIDVTAKAGYQAIEPWVSSIHEYKAGGSALGDLRNRIAGHGLTVESAIAFPEWIAEDPNRRAKGLEQARRDMDAVALIGGKRIAMPPAGVQHEEIALARIAERYRAVLELGDQLGVVPELEFWGSSPCLNRLSQAVYAALETHHPKACVLADVFHLYKGGSGFEGLRLLSGQAIQVIHLNDYPGNPPRADIKDSDRVYPGDGVAPLNRILSDLQRVAPGLVLSLELFNPAYWKGDPLETARTGLAKMKAAARGAGSN